MNYNFVNKEKFTNHFDLSLRQQLKGDVALSYIYNVKEFSWFDKNTMKEQMKQWRKLAKQGKLIMRKCNNKNFEYEGKEYYLLEVQGIQDDPICLIGLFIAGLMVNGFGYVFLNEENRDRVYEYVMKGIVVDDDE